VNPKVYRYVLWPLWFLVLPLVLSRLTVQLLSPGDGFEPVTLLDRVLWAIEDQPIPATIGFFTLYEMLIYHYRHVLPLAALVGVGGRTDVPKNARREFDHAGQLLDEADRILRKNRSAVEAGVSAAGRDELADGLEALRSSMNRTPFVEEEFHDAHDKAGRLVAKHLGRWQKGELREYIESIAVAIFVALLLRALVIEAFKIPSGSMLPTLQIQDHIFVNKLSYGPLIPFTSARVVDGLPPKRGDVIVFVFPESNQDAPQDFIKRAIALPGDTLVVDGGHPIINGWRVPSCRVGDYAYHEGGDAREKRGELFIEFLGEYAYFTLYEDRPSDGRQGPYHVQPGETWVLGDNRNNSSDSRAWYGGRGGGVPDANIKGRAMFVWWSVAFDRLFMNVMGTPRLPKGASPEILAGIDRCLRERPTPSEATPPPPVASLPAESGGMSALR
jgi:signal peptidase I